MLWEWRYLKKERLFDVNIMKGEINYLFISFKKSSKEACGLLGVFGRKKDFCSKLKLKFVV